MKNENATMVSGLFGAPERITVERGLAEFRGGRPVIVAGAAEALIALPVDGIDAGRLASFARVCGPHTPRLIISTRRARTLGLEASGPMTLTIGGELDLGAIRSLVADRETQQKFEAVHAAPAATACIKLAKMAHLLPALLAADIDPAIAARFDPPLVTVDAAAVASFRSDTVQSLTIVGEARVPLAGGLSARFIVFRDAIGGGSVAIIVGAPDFSRPVPVRLHSACLTGDVFGSRRCDCGDQLKLALAHLDAAGGGVILYLEQEGRGLGLANKMRAYELQDAGLDTVDANTTLGFNDDERDYGVAARMLEMLECTRITLLTNNPAKLDALAGAGIEISGRMPLHTPINA
ncbi:MAG TPA: GTP cyclohydrolase II, partial [Xanthobacteraceae bacterium]|nr:GTP cyclohydrolase II [Xanthobacteraceae bacterium]